MVPQKILRRALFLLEESFPNPTKEDLSSLPGEALRRSFLQVPPLESALPCPYSLLWQAVEEENLNVGMLPPVVGYEHPKYQLSYWFDGVVLEEIHLAYYGEDPNTLWRSLYNIDLDGGNAYHQFVDDATWLSRTINCPFRRIKQILQNILEGHKAYHHNEERAYQCRDSLRQRKHSQKLIGKGGLDPEVVGIV